MLGNVRTTNRRRGSKAEARIEAGRASVGHAWTAPVGRRPVENAAGIDATGPAVRCLKRRLASAWCFSQRREYQ